MVFNYSVYICFQHNYQFYFRLIGLGSGATLKDMGRGLPYSPMQSSERCVNALKPLFSPKHTIAGP